MSTPPKTKKIAIVVRHETSQKCIGKGCLRAFNQKEDSFKQYEGENIELVAFCDDGGVSDDRIENIKTRITKFKKIGVDAVHVSTCNRAKNPDYDQMMSLFAEEFEVVGYTHGSATKRQTTKGSGESSYHAKEDERNNDERF